jgi:hypothetical protein
MTFRQAIFVALGCALAFTTTSAAHAAKRGEFCGGAAGVSCDKGLWCDPDPGKCGAADWSGRCKKDPPRPCRGPMLTFPPNPFHR